MSFKDENVTYNEYVKLSIESGVEPLLINFFPISGFDSEVPFAFFTETTVRSVILGDREEKSYTYVSDVRDCGKELFLHNIKHIIYAVKEFEKKGKEISFLSVRCPSELVEKEDLYALLSELFKEFPFFDSKKLCVCFPAEITEKDFEKAKTAILDLKLLKIKTAVSGCGKAEFPLSKLTELNFDIAVIDQTATAYAGSRNKPQVLSSLVSYIKSMGADSIAKGTLENKKSMRGTDCIGFCDINARPLSLKQAIDSIKEE